MGTVGTTVWASEHIGLLAGFDRFSTDHRFAVGCFTAPHRAVGAEDRLPAVHVSRVFQNPCPLAPGGQRTLLSGCRC